jgi:SanA protein
MRGLKFLGFLLLWLLVVLAGIAWYNYDSVQAFWAELADISQFLGNILEKVNFYFSNAGSWNYLILLLMISLLVVLFTLNDLWMGRYFKASKKKGFFSRGFSWFGQRVSAFVLLVLEFTIVANLVVWGYAHSKTVKNATALKEAQTILLLGTNKKLRDREGLNLYYTYRIDAVSDLYRKGKVKKIIISGDNSRVGYNEPADMRHSLLAKGVPAHLIELDYAGFRTLDSIVRLKGHFGERKALIVSQQFHVERALLLAWFYDVEATGFPAEGSPTMAMAWRELMAKPKALLDVFVFNMQPRYGKTYAKASLDMQHQKDQAFLGIVIFFCLFALLMAYLCYTD